MPHDDNVDGTAQSRIVDALVVRVSRGWSKRVIYYFRLRVERRAACSGYERALHLAELNGVADAALDQVPARRGGPARVARLWSALIFVPSGRAGAAGSSKTVKISDYESP